MRILKICVGAAIAMALVAVGFAHANVDNAGQTAASFLSSGAGPRILGMGGATLGLGDDVTAGAWNPAALGWASRNEFVITHVGLANQSSQEWAGFGGRLGSTDTHWALTGLFQGEGSFQGRDASNTPTTDFSASSMAFGAHVAQQFGGRMTVGLAAKSVLEKLGDVSGFGFTFDGGAMYRAGMFGFGVAGQNLGGQMRYNTIVYQFPANVGVGVAVCPPGTGLRFALDANFPKAYYTDVRAGVEWLWRDMVAVRGGYRHELSDVTDGLTGPSFGLGAGRNGFWFDYGYLVGSNGEAEHRVGLRIVPGSIGASGGAFGYNDPSRPVEPTASVRPASSRQPKVAAPRREPVAKATPEKTKPAASPTTTPVAALTPGPVVAPPPAKKPAATTEGPSAAPKGSETSAGAAAKPAESPAKNPPAVEAQPEPRPSSVKVKPGETLYVIARRWNTSPASIMMENNLVSDQVQVGQTLKLPRH